MEDNNDRRRHRRILFEARVVLVDGGRSWKCTMLDISLKGALLDMPEDFKSAASRTYTLQIGLGSDTLIEMNVIPVHDQNGVLGVKWHDIDLESITHLRRLMELNLGESLDLNRELTELNSPE